ncbi:MAG TPA: Gfo/Idh/MocA family oxidoreductase [Blastocatellia bacterium]|nr:Gfo/Idh/MocA family oxidoreductase [Blastocatellia bacterium]
MTTHIGILGGGNISGTHARAASEIEGVEVAAVYGENLEKASAIAHESGGVVCDDLQAFLEHRPMNIVAIGSPSGLHAEHGIAAARAGLHVLVEKPIDVRTDRADALIEECERARVKLGVFFQDRVKSGIVRLKQFIDAGKLGKPILVSAQVKWYRPPEYYSGSRWRGIWKLDGGGALMNQGVHTVDLLLWLMGPVEKVYARAVTALHKIETEDTVVATLEFASGAVGTLEAATSAYPGYRRRLELTGSEGTIILEHDRVIAADLHTPAEELGGGEEADSNASASSPVVSDVRGHRMIIEDFLESIRTDGTPRCDGREGRKSVALVEAIYESSRSGTPVVLSPEC